ncbi:hypothetical protein KI387_043750 [Taxus chinensis]|uniref:Uncharacterized protein n=1 Tax=Taxus chinensis TaxID=29808 RepID=A0AA38LL93_TAXCH|nr:hypothetical protein KI387_043750 [Taxus chinensis]
MAQPLNPFVNFTGSSPLALNAQNPVPIAALKNIPFFTTENHTTPGDHVKYIANVCAIHEINEMDVAVKLLASSFKGKALQWSWDRIPVAVRPTVEGAFLYYLIALNSDISMLIQSMGGTTLPAAYSIAIRAENCLIQAGKLAPRPRMPLYPSLESPSASQAPVLAPIPTPRNQSSNEASTSSPSAPNELQEVLKQLQNLGNELVTLKRQQAQGFRPSYQPQAQPNR